MQLKRLQIYFYLFRLVWHSMVYSNKVIWSSYCKPSYSYFPGNRNQTRYIHVWLNSLRWAGLSFNTSEDKKQNTEEEWGFICMHQFWLSCVNVVMVSTIHTTTKYAKWGLNQFNYKYILKFKKKSSIIKNDINKGHVHICFDIISKDESYI